MGGGWYYVGLHTREAFGVLQKEQESRFALGSRWCIGQHWVRGRGLKG